MTTNSSIDYSLEMNSTHLLEVKYNAPSDASDGLSHTYGDYLSENQQQELWQGFAAEEMDNFLQRASLPQINAFLQNMSFAQAAYFFSKANQKEALYALSQLSSATLNALICPPAPLSKEDLSIALEQLTPANQKTLFEINSLFKPLLQAQAAGQARIAADISREISLQAASLSTDSGSGYDVPQSTVNLGDTLAAFADWIASINDLMAVVALTAADEAQASTNYALEESDLLTAALVGDEWNDDWAGDSSSDHEGTGFETGYYVPGIDSIPADATDDEGNDVTAYWQTIANENYQQIETTYSSWVSETQSWAQNSADLVNTLSTNTQSYYDIIGSINDIMSNIQQLTARTY